MELIESEVYKGHTINVYPDEGVGNPLHEHDLMCTFVSFHSNYNLGNTKDFKTRGDFLEFWEENIKDLIVLPLTILELPSVLENFPAPGTAGNLAGYFMIEGMIKTRGIPIIRKRRL